MRAIQKQIFVACRQLGLDNDTRKALQLQVVGKESLSEMTEAERRAVLEALKLRGFRPTRAGRPQAARPDVRYCHVMWRLVVEAGEAHVAGAAGLNAFIRARFGKTWGNVPIDIDVMTQAREIRDVVEALKGWCLRARLAGFEK